MKTLTSPNARHIGETPAHEYGSPPAAPGLPAEHPARAAGAASSRPEAPHLAPCRATAAKHLVIYLADLSGGGAERLHIRLAPHFIAAGHRVTFLLDRYKGELLSQLPEGCRLDVLGAPRQLRALPKLVGYLRRARPDLLIANMEHMNVMAVLARALARAPTRIVVSQHSAFSDQIGRGWRFRILPVLYKLALPFADRIVAVSQGVADELADGFGLPRSALAVIHNGVVAADIDERAAAEPRHPWFAEPGPVILAMGRLTPQKDFATLIDAFAQIAGRTGARLVILGEGPLRGALEAQIRSLGNLGERVSLPGFVDDPLPFLKRARLFVLSSRGEGFGNVLAEALACGTPVVSTDCPYGPGEILERGRHGRLVPVGDPDAMAAAMLAALSETPQTEAIMRRGRSFSVVRCAEAYLDLIDSLPPATPAARSAP